MRVTKNVLLHERKKLGSSRSTPDSFLSLILIEQNTRSVRTVRNYHLRAPKSLGVFQPDLCFFFVREVLHLHTSL